MAIIQNRRYLFEKEETFLFTCMSDCSEMSLHSRTLKSLLTPVSHCLYRQDVGSGRQQTLKPQLTLCLKHIKNKSMDYRYMSFWPGNLWIWTDVVSPIRFWLRSFRNCNKCHQFVDLPMISCQSTMFLQVTRNSRVCLAN